MEEWNTFETFDQENEKKKKRRTWIACGVIALLLALCSLRRGWDRHPGTFQPAAKPERDDHRPA
jgi:hypothetical protein